MTKRIIIAAVLILSVVTTATFGTIKVEKTLCNLEKAVISEDSDRIKSLWKTDKKYMLIFLDHNTFSELDKNISTTVNFSNRKNEIVFQIEQIRSSILPKIENIL